MPPPILDKIEGYFGRSGFFILFSVLCTSWQNFQIKIFIYTSISSNLMVFNIQEDLIQEDDNKTQDHLASPLPGLISYYPPPWSLYYSLPGFVSLLPASGPWPNLFTSNALALYLSFSYPSRLDKLFHLLGYSLNIPFSGKPPLGPQKW